MTTEGRPPCGITVVNARVHNLKQVDCHIPYGALTVVTGPSGSGKSSLAFDTLFAEGQRRYLESLSSYVRQFLERMEKPDVERIDGILPAIALEQKNSVKNARSTVGTATRLQDDLQLLFGHCGQVRCSHCGSWNVGYLSPDAVTQTLASWPEKTRLLILAPVSLRKQLPADLAQQGYFRFVHPATQELEAFTANTTVADFPTAIQETLLLPLLVDRLAIKANDEANEQRVRDAVSRAMKLADNAVVVRRLGNPPEDCVFQTGYACRDCGTPQLQPTPAAFSYNSPLGACPTCEGFGRVMGLDPERIVPNRELSLAEGAIHPFQTPANQELHALLLAEAPAHNVPVDVPYNQLTAEQQARVWEGFGTYPGIRGFFHWLETKRYKVHVRITLARYRGYYDCPACQGARIRPERLNVFVGGHHYLDWVQTPLATLLDWVEQLALPQHLQPVGDPILADLKAQLRYLCDVGLGYLTIQRTMRTLSGGEAQRIHLAAALGTALTETLYVLDEPTVGLHARDTQRLLVAMKRLRDLGNTLVVVEHDPDVMEQADYVLDIGPGSGEQGGRIVYAGDLPGLKQSDTLTGCWLRQDEKRLAPASQTAHPSACLEPANPAAPGCNNASAAIVIRGACGHNLRQLTVRIPTGQLVVVTGVSGSGKSTLIRQTLYGQYLLTQGELPPFETTPCEAIEGLEAFGEVHFVDQSPPGRSTRSNPVTYVKAFDDIRQLFAASPKAQAMGLAAGDFSFNAAGGRCERCEGLGFLTVDMQFMADVHMVCPDCNGKRFQPSVLSVELFDRNLDDVLNMTVSEALQFFKTAPKIRRRLEPLQELGLGYLRLGQSTATLSGGEAQRLKLANHLPPKGKQAKVPHLFLFDEPTTGLHPNDVQTLVAVLRRLVEAGHSLIVVEHNLQLIRQADWVIDLGPEAGSGGGQLVAEGPPAHIQTCSASWTGRYL